MVVRVIVDRRPHLDAVAASHEAHDRLQPDVRELELDQELAHELVVPDDAGRDHVRPTSRAAGAERVEIAGVGLVLDCVQPGEAPTGTTIGDGERPVSGHVDREKIDGRRRGLRQARLEPLELDEHALSVRLDETTAAIRQRVDERPAATERFARDDVDRAIELLVADEHVAVNFVAGAAADRVVRMVPEQVAPGEPKIVMRERVVVAKRAERGSGLGVEHASARPVRWLV